MATAFLMRGGGIDRTTVPFNAAEGLMEMICRHKPRRAASLRTDGSRRSPLAAPRFRNVQAGRRRRHPAGGDIELGCVCVFVCRGCCCCCCCLGGSSGSFGGESVRIVSMSSPRHCLQITTRDGGSTRGAACPGGRPWSSRGRSFIDHPSLRTLSCGFVLVREGKWSRAAAPMGFLGTRWHKRMFFMPLSRHESVEGSADRREIHWDD